MYTSEKTGDDASGDGSAEKPFHSVMKAMKSSGEPFPTIYVDSKEEDKVSI